jgi:HlyD family secretion protein
VDIARPDLLEKKKKKQLTWIAVGVAAVVLLTLGVSRLKPAAPTVERATVVIDTVRRGEMVREVRGLGTLVPEDIRWIALQTEARVERRVLLPGTIVKPDSVILELSNPELENQAQEADSQARAAEAQLTELKVRLESQLLDQKAAAARVEAESKQARLRADADDELHKNGLIADITLKLSQSAAAELEHREKIEHQRLAIAGEAIEAQLKVQQADVENKRAAARLRRSQVEALHLRAGIDGVLQQVPVEVGQRVAAGTNLARVARPNKLKAEVRIPETQAKDVVEGQKAVVDTRNGFVAGRVIRVDPAVQNGTVTVDIALTGELPPGARPDLTVDGTIELERLPDAVFVGRPGDGPADEHDRAVPAGEGHERGRARAGRARPGVGEHDRGQGRARRGRRGDPVRHLGMGFRGPDPVELKRGSMTTDNALIKLEGLGKVFYTDEVETHALSDIHLEIKKGEYVAISGPSGCGKSTLLSILGLLDSPTGGSYRLNANSVQDLGAAQRARIRNREIGFIFQSFNLIGDLSVYENVELPLTVPRHARGRAQGAHAQGARARGHGAPRQAPAEPALGRSAAARRRGARARRRALDPAGGRAHREPRLEERRGRHGAAARPAPRRLDDLHGHARQPLLPPRRAHRPPVRRPRGERGGGGAGRGRGFGRQGLIGDDGGIGRTQMATLTMHEDFGAFSSGDEQVDLKSRLLAYERNLISAALTETGGNQRRAARQLGILPTTLHEKMKRLGLRADVFMPAADAQEAPASDPSARA